MAFIGKLAGVSGRRLLFGKRLDGPFGGPGGHHETEFRLANDGKVLRDGQPGVVSDLKIGMEVKVCGVPFTADDPPQPSTEASAVVILG